MTILDALRPQKFDLLSIGPRGVGKTVFLAGCYQQIKTGPARDPLTFDCAERSAREKLEALLGYIRAEGAYPPATERISNFALRLRSTGLLSRTLCHFNWRDLPGEQCHTGDAEFRALSATCQGLIAFLDGEALIRDPDYLKYSGRQVVDFVTRIASLMRLNGVRYPIALVVTKCDLLDKAGLHTYLIEEQLTPLLSELQASGNPHRLFHFAVEIHQGTMIPTGGNPLLWIASEVLEIYNPSLSKLVGGWMRSFTFSRKVSSPLAGKP